MVEISDLVWKAVMPEPEPEDITTAVSEPSANAVA